MLSHRASLAEPILNRTDGIGELKNRSAGELLRRPGANHCFYSLLLLSTNSNERSISRKLAGIWLE